MESYLRTQFLEVIGDARLGIVVKLVLAAFLAIVADKEREEIRGRGSLLLVLVDNGLHILLPTDAEALTSLASGIVQITVTDIGLAEVRQVDERDAPEIIAHQECVSCQLLLWGEFGIKTLDVADRCRRNGSLAGFVDARIDILEGMPLGSKPILYGTVIDSTKYAHIEGTGVAAYSCHVLQVCFVRFYHIGIQLCKGSVLLMAESHETVEGGLVMEHRAMLTVGFQLCDDAGHELG